MTKPFNSQLPPTPAKTMTLVIHRQNKNRMIKDEVINGDEGAILWVEIQSGESAIYVNVDERTGQIYATATRGRLALEPVSAQVVGIKVVNS